jgi:hypothetical protein
MKILKTLLALLLTTSCLAQGGHRLSQVITRGPGIAANVVPFATVNVCVAGTFCNTLQPVFSDLALTQPLTQPVVADAGGNFDYYVADGCHDEQYSAPTLGVITRYNVCTGGGSGPIVEVNGTPLLTASPVNLVDSATVTFTNSSAGVIQATAASGPALTLQHNSVNLPDQVLLNFLDTGTPATTTINAAGGTWMIVSRPLGQTQNGVMWSNFAAPTLPSDAVIQGIYPVIVGSANFNLSTTMTFRYGIVNLTAFPGGASFASPSDPDNTTFSSTEYYAPSIGSSLTFLTSQGMVAEIISSLGLDGMKDTQSVTALGYAIYYTSATPSVDSRIPAPFTVPSGQGIAWAVPSTVATTMGTGQGLVQITQSSVTSGTATFSYTPLAGVPLAVGKTVVIENTTIGGGILNSPQGRTVATVGTGTFTVTGFSGTFATQAENAQMVYGDGGTGTGGATGTPAMAAPASGSSAVIFQPNSTGGLSAFVPLSGSSTPAPQYIAPQAISGCGVEYVTGLTYTVGACTYSINGVTYNSPLSTVTLGTADPTNPRIDAIFVDTTQVVQVLPGTPAATPQQPVVDPSTQLELTFVLVPNASTTPANTTLVNIYDEGTEWTPAKGGTSSANVNLTSTNNPYHGTHDTEFGTSGTVTTTTYAQYTDPSSGTVNLSNYNALVFYLRNKAAWPSTRSITAQWYNGAAAKGTAVVLSSGAFGFNSTTNITTYQQVSIPVSTFGIAGIPVTTLRFTVSGTGAALTGFYLDEVTLQGGTGGVILPTTLMNYKGAYSATATYSPNDTVVSGGIGYVAIAASTNQAVTTTAFWTPLASATSNGFPITLGSTSIAASSTTTAVTGLSVNGVSLTTGGSSTAFLNGAGAYTTPAGSGMVYPGAGIPLSTGSAWGTSYAAPTGSIVGTTDTQTLTNKTVNGVGLTAAGSSTAFLNGAGGYTTPAGSGFSNPMTTAGDLIDGGSSGTPQRLGIGSTGQVLTVVSGAPAWQPASGGSGGVQYNSALTDYNFYGDSIFIVSSSCIVSSSGVGTITAGTVSGTTLTATATNTQTANNVITLSGFTGGYTALNGQVVTILSAGLSGSQFEVTVSGVSAGSTGTGAFGCTFSWPAQTSREPLFNGHGTVHDLGIAGGSSATLVSNYTASVHPHTFAVTGNPCYVLTHDGVNDFPTALSTVEANLQSVWASAHTDGCTVVAFTDLPFPWNLSTQPTGPYYQAQLSNWIRAQKKTSATTGGQYADSIIDIAPIVSNSADPLMIQQGGSDIGHPTDAGAAALADKTNEGMAVQGSSLSAIQGQAIYQGSQTIQYVTPIFTLTDTGAGAASYQLAAFDNGGSGGYPFLRVNGQIANSWHIVGGGMADTLPAGSYFGINSTPTVGTGPPDTCISRDSADVWDFGDCSSNTNKSAILKAAQGIFSTSATINGVTISGTPAAGQAIIATGPTSAGWATPAGSACGTANIPCTNTANSYTTGGQNIVTGTPTTVGQTISGTTGALTPVFVQGKGDGSFGGPPKSVAFTSNVTTGNAILIAVLGVAGAPAYSASDTLGNTFIALATSTAIGGRQVEVFGAFGIAGGADTVTVNNTGGGGFSYEAMTISEYSGVAASSALDTQTTTGGGSYSTPVTVGPITTTASDLIFTAFFRNAGAISASAAGYTNRASAVGGTLGSAIQTADTNAAAGSLSAIWSETSGSTSFAAVIIGLKATALAAQSADIQDVTRTSGGTLAAAATVNGYKALSFQNIGTTFTASGCSNSTLVGGSSAGSFNSGTTGTCTVTVTMGNSVAASHGWACFPHDLTTPADVINETATTTTTVTFSGTTVTADVINFGCEAY